MVPTVNPTVGQTEAQTVVPKVGLTVNPTVGQAVGQAVGKPADKTEGNANRDGTAINDPHSRSMTSGQLTSEVQVLATNVRTHPRCL